MNKAFKKKVAMGGLAFILMGTLTSCSQLLDSENPGSIVSRTVEFLADVSDEGVPVVEAPSGDPVLDETPTVSAAFVQAGVVYSLNYNHFNGNLGVFIFGAGVAKPTYVKRYTIAKPRVATIVYLKWVPSDIIPNSNAYTAVIPMKAQESVAFGPNSNLLTDNYFTGNRDVQCVVLPRANTFVRNRISMKFEPGEPTVYGQLRLFTEYNTDDVSSVAYWAGSQWNFIARQKFNEPDSTVMTWYNFYNATKFRVWFTSTGGDNFIYLDKKDEADWTVTRVGNNINGHNVLDVTHK